MMPSMQYVSAANALGTRVEKSITAANGEVDIFTVSGGIVLITAIVGEVTTAIGGTASNLKLTFDPTATTGTTVDICAAVAVTSDPVGTLYSPRLNLNNGNLIEGETGAVVRTDGHLYVQNGIITADFDADPVGGVIRWVCFFVPIDAGASVVAS